MPDLQKQIEFLNEEGARRCGFKLGVIIAVCKWHGNAVREYPICENSCYYCNGKNLNCKFYMPDLR